MYALQEARTFPSDQPPHGFGPVRLEQNDVAVLLRSDSLAHITAATTALFGHGNNQAGHLFTVTSIRQGFAGGGFYGQQGLPSKLALAAGIPGAQSIPRQAPLFLGFTSTLVSNMGPGNIANLETLPGLTDQWPNGYFKQGTTMHLSHLYEDLETWYQQNFPKYDQQVQAMQYPGVSPASGTYALQPPGQSETQVTQRPEAAPRLRPQRQPLGRGQHRISHNQQLRHHLPRRNHDPRTRRLQHARQPIPLHIRPDSRPPQHATSSRPALPHVPTNDRNLQQRPALDGRPLPRQNTPNLPALPTRRHQLSPAHNPPPELPRPTTPPPLVPARRVPRLTLSVPVIRFGRSWRFHAGRARPGLSGGACYTGVYDRLVPARPGAVRATSRSEDAMVAACGWSLRGALVFVDDAAEEIASTDPVERDDSGLCFRGLSWPRLGERRPLVE